MRMDVPTLINKLIQKKPNVWTVITIIFLIVIIAYFRIRIYQDSLSIGTADTGVFIGNCNIPTFSWEFFTSSRPLTISLLYKLLEPQNGYQLTEVSWAWIGTAPDKEYQEGLSRISLMQSILSIFCWSLLAWIVSRHLQYLLLKIFSVLLILTFAYSPQLADWDGVLMSESVSFSLFALLLGLSIEFVFCLLKNGKKPSKLIYLICALWLIVFTFWVFSRDTNSYFLLLSIFMLFILALIPLFRKKFDTKLIFILCLIMSGIFIFHNISLRGSDRWINPLLNNILKNVLPYPDRLEFFETRGMPVSDKLLSFIGKDGNEVGFWELDDFISWIRTRGFSTYQWYLIRNPIWSFQRLFSNLDAMFVGNRQPYFRGTPASTPLWMIPIGDILHLRFTSVVWIDFILTILLLAICIWITFRQNDRNELNVTKISTNIDNQFVTNKFGFLYAWASIFIWLFLGEMALLFVSYHGDALGILRHTLVAVMPLRLSLWLLLIVIFDIVIFIVKNIYRERTRKG